MSPAYHWLDLLLWRVAVTDRAVLWTWHRLMEMTRRDDGLFCDKFVRRWS
jgi:hypothetical protein